MKKDVLVTGGAGFIGSNLVRLLLSRGYAVRVLDNLTTGYQENLEGLQGVEFVKGDIMDAPLLQKMVQGTSVVFHMAAAVGNVRSLEDPHFDANINVMGTLNVLEAARKTNVRKIVFSSSAAIFGEPVEMPITEDHPVNPDSPYGVSKLAAEKYCLCYNRLYGMENVCLRYFNVYGQHQRYDAYGNVIPIFLTKLRRGEALTVYGDGEQTRDFINVKDIAMANLLSAETPGASGPINIGTGSAITVNTLTQLIQKLGKDGTVAYKPARAGEVLHSRANISKAQSMLNFQPSVHLAEGLKIHAEWLNTLESAS
ncbi:MAG: epimerase [Deltaproteobacteria bacterium CG11_big_fil_rev_8_21_14_0_20_47_16]|nr:MAG: epimerase [Deltaproteobacteria bacterium CG11_big_fil_rev_8_21_14_0_20_47_16]